MGSKYYNPSLVDLQRAVEGIINDGGDVKVDHKPGYDHVVAYSKKSNRHLSFDVYPDGHVERVHTDQNNGGYVTYGGGFDW